MWLCKRDLSKECEGKYKDCTDCVLDKIRTEIAEKKQNINFNGLDDYEKAQAEMRLSTLNEILQIIDKYKIGGSEGK